MAGGPRGRQDKKDMAGERKGGGHGRPGRIYGGRKPANRGMGGKEGKVLHPHIPPDQGPDQVATHQLTSMEVFGWDELQGLPQPSRVTAGLPLPNHPLHNLNPLHPHNF